MNNSLYQDNLVQLSNAQQKIDNIKQTFAEFKQWEDRYRFIMQSGKKLAQYPEQHLQDENLITGCESQVWLCHEATTQGIHFFATSDARIVKGLLWLLLEPINGLSAEQIIQFDLEAYFNQLGLIKHLSPSRGNGLLNIAKQIKQICQQQLHSQ